MDTDQRQPKLENFIGSFISTQLTFNRQLSMQSSNQPPCALALCTSLISQMSNNILISSWRSTTQCYRLRDHQFSLGGFVLEIFGLLLIILNKIGIQNHLCFYHVSSHLVIRTSGVHPLPFQTILLKFELLNSFYLVSISYFFQFTKFQSSVTFIHAGALETQL